MRVTVIGAGTMGAGIAHVCAAAGHDVSIRDIEPNVVMDAIDTISNRLSAGVDRGYITAEEKEQAVDDLDGTTDLESALKGADIVIEAVPEDLDLKRETFADAEGQVDEETIIATNTSSMSVSSIAAALKHPERAVGLHFFNPPHKMGLIEVVLADQTDEETADRAEAFVDGLEKEPVVVTDTPGFASSRLGVALGVEAMRMVENGVASVEDIDAAMELGYNHPVGPLELTDRVGLDVRLDICEYLHEELGDRFEPPEILREKVENGDTGKKVGRGFYVWEGGEPKDVADDEDYDIEDVI
ncbi:3-hydroxyacyl-CoA dehydrogenase family protein [Halorientalis regularis]|jgi:3-hydroxybutyryl-CoA dehydrogenase|uniref:3-hydroxyacyl-CoA dehydrogenase n=1 Tax=Halorientalis regularis TaxID=660518 RepID=A0A1G7MXL4_9EURY|nr:3-hydroxyacyl-CoA dehydrogenase family protein [Halorientalis regularis]SDF66543.1 3-hydroxyacyl-CoA dehydrogenase [Halorientalis regularis]